MITKLKKYEKPAIEVIKVKMSNQLLAGSGEAEAKASMSVYFEEEDI